MKRGFYFYISLAFWLFMVVGFSDNWLFDIGQESNSQPKFLVHAFIAFSWFTLLVVQTGLMTRNHVKTHMRLGVAGMVIYPCFVAITSYIYLTNYLSRRTIEPLSLLNMTLFIFASFLIFRAFRLRKQNPLGHKTNMIIGTFMLMEPGISRTTGLLFAGVSELIWLLTYVALFAVFVWHFRKITWQIAVGFGIWLAGTINIVLSLT